ncbi:MAG: tetratricopeptide repeat protein [Actinophytocola sp.]|uniref:tetratricopeptide repeat protein n=1 Tax=Actinophytocola sp. TaxID=1872138 RepID=UPI003D6AA6DD
MYQPQEPAVDLSWTSPPRPRAPRDPVAVALGNASLFGVGYLLLGRRLLGVATALISLVLLVVLGSAAHSGWLQWLLLGWWAGMIGHGWLAARRVPTTTMTGQRVGAGVLAVVVLGAFVVVRFDVDGRADDMDVAHADGDCGLALSIVDGVGFWQRIGDGPVADGMLDAAAACRLVQRAREQATTDRLLAAETMAGYERRPDARWTGARRYREDLLLDQAGDDLLAGLTDAHRLDLEHGFDLLARLRSEFPNRQHDADAVLDDFLAGLPTDDACRTVDVTDWIARQDAETEELDRAGPVVAEVAPDALLACADTRLAAGDPTGARDRYRQLLDTYPNDPGAARAKRGSTLATWAIQLGEVRALVQTTYPNEIPDYCGNPKPYGAAPRYSGRGTFRAMVFGQDTQRNSLPKAWRAADPKNAALVICAGETDYGAVTETCPYVPTTGGGPTRYVSFHKQKVPVRVYEVRTGRRVSNRALQIGGTSCPQIISVETYGTDIGPGSQYVESSRADIRAAYQPLIVR